MTRILGAILAGGRSRRFGSDKAAAMLGGISLLDRAIAALEAQTTAILVCGRVMAGRDCTPDRPCPDLGPLGGLNAALHWAAGHGFDHVVTAPCDTPALPPDLIVRLAAPGGPAIVADMPVIGFWPVTLAAPLDTHLATSDDRSMRAWTRTIGAAAIAVDGLANVNTPGDLDRLANSVTPSRPTDR